ncbi:MAG: hypothetical protein A2176_06515 [Spirochaetes bacterium RBG_13_51_14]|nr:MAG: hypothetical protein A2176_06515 [Spirochaetes bacterium RBG_13_51_14]
MESNYIFDNNNDMIVQGLKFVDGKDTFYLYKINGSGQIRWSTSSTGFGVLKNDNENNIYYIQEVYTLETQSGIKHTLTKYSPDGQIIRENQNIDSTYSITLNDWVIDRFGNVFLMGEGASNNEIVKINPGGDVLWRQNIPESWRKLITDSTGNPYAGFIYNTTGGKHDIRIVKCDGDTGSVLWDKTCLSNVSESSFDLMTDAADNLILVRNGRAATIDTFDPSGNQVWEYAYTPSDIGLSIDVDAGVKCDGAGNVIISAVVSVLTGSIPNGTSFPYPLGYQYCQLMMIDKNGKKTWSKKVSTILIYNGDIGGHLYLDKNNDIYVFCQDTTFTKYDKNGKKVWSFTPEITEVPSYTPGYFSEWHADSDLNLYWIWQGNSLDVPEYYRITKFKQQ